MQVALLAEGVDRNTPYDVCRCMAEMSPSSRRAWIEMLQSMRTNISRFVALLAEGVDRNLLGEHTGQLGVVSPSSRRAWIEIG